MITHQQKKGDHLSWIDQIKKSTNGIVLFGISATKLKKSILKSSYQGEIIVKKHNSGDNTGVVLLENKYIKAEFNSVTGKLTSLPNKIDQQTRPLLQLCGVL